MRRVPASRAVGASVAAVLGALLGVAPVTFTPAVAVDGPIGNGYTCYTTEDLCLPDPEKLGVRYGTPPLASAPLPIPVWDSSTDTPCALVCDFHGTVSKYPVAVPVPTVALPEAALSASTGTMTMGDLGRAEVESQSDLSDFVSAPTDVAGGVQADVTDAVGVSAQDYQSNYAARNRVTDSRKGPYRMTAFVSATFPNGTSGSCTGFILSSSLVGTAGHCIYDHNRGGWATDVVVTPGLNGAGTNPPYGWCYAKNLYSVYGWTRDRKYSYDYGGIKLDCGIGSKTGKYGMLAKAKVQNDMSRLNGYPGGAPLNKPYQTQWTARGTLSDPDNKKLIYHRIQIGGGDSGAAVLEVGCGYYCVVGLFTFKEMRYGYQAHNAGPRMTDQVIGNYRNWISDGVVYA